MQFLQSAEKLYPQHAYNKKPKTKVYPEDILSALILLLSPIANLSLQATSLGIFGASASAPFVGLLFLFISYRSLSKGIIRRETAIIITYVIVISTLYLLFTPQQTKDETTLLKAIKILIFYTLSTSLVLTKNRNYSILKLGAWGGLLLCVASTLPTLSDISFLNYEGSSEGRPRGLTMEASHFAFISGSLALIIFSLDPRTINKVIASLIGALLLIYSQSKAGIVLYVAGFYILLTIQAKSKKYIVITSALILITSYIAISYILPYILGRISIDMDNYTSTATRTIGFMSGIYIALHNPFGVGFGAYLNEYLSSIPYVIRLARPYLPYLDYSEVIGYTTQQTTKSISTKSFLSDSIIYFGIPFVFFLLLKTRKIISNILRNRKSHLIPGFFFIISSLSFWSTGIGFYPAFILISITINLSQDNNKS
ncbi:hypothetical protein SAMN05216189_1007143 [Pseudomonas delhiensis]|uniref:O-antigen ligase-related domain-containing protein n=1 Tax=Pseudomonas delhiensis TaxID=366289 RepID=A0A239IPK3_9PSED|nr:MULTISPECIES: O-antigen ligase family protein [Pseudomonas]SDI66092.1 hypothetical protein SAMN05216189_1007143 [Pseudomonas delhiensis]SNS95590.1 hypothetical protein SAMN06295949_110143 [Pseudomonas delhiensis]